ncbi:MAG: DUF4396 domain-containing protein [Thermodesulfobacteriota bacterium]
MMIPEGFLGGVLVVWYLLTAGSLIFLIWDLWTNTPSMWVMKLAWILIVLYTGPIGLFVFLISCRQPLPDTHDQFIASHWKQSVGSLMHCVAGDATGIILAAAIASVLQVPSGIDLIMEYTTAFVFGLFIFQALFMKSIMGGDYFKAVKKTFFAETVSMNMVMVGMIPIMAILRSRLSEGRDPDNLLFWGIAGFAAIVGGIMAYPINSWMVGKGLKHGMMTASSGMMSMSHHDHVPKDISFSYKFLVVVFTALILLFAILITSRFVHFRF